MQANGHQRKLSRREAAARSGLSLKTIDRLIRSGGLASSKPCGRRVIAVEDLEATMCKNRTESAASYQSMRQELWELRRRIEALEKVGAEPGQPMEAAA